MTPTCKAVFLPLCHQAYVHKQAIVLSESQNNGITENGLQFTPTTSDPLAKRALVELLTTALSPCFHLSSHAVRQKEKGGGTAIYSVTHALDYSSLWCALMSEIIAGAECQVSQGERQALGVFVKNDC